ncbi:MAG: YqzL family protein [Bacillota bacterium]|jgi:hypothetical protein
MSLGNAMWDIFRHTGDISAYLVYKDCLECQKKENHMAAEKVKEDR